MSFTLERLLDNPSTPPFQEFSSFVRSRYCAENLFFWHAVRGYERDYDAAQQQCDKTAGLLDQCMAIVRTYVEPNSPYEINIPCEMRDHIIDHVYQQHDCDPQVFVPASKVTLELMRVNAFLPWLAEWAPSLLPTPPKPMPSASTSMVHSVSSPEGWTAETAAADTSCPRASFSSFRSERANDVISARSPFSPSAALMKKIKATLLHVTSVPTRQSAIFVSKKL
ncbi:RGS domain-containing protein [Gongronella butleri]|nr:RGS domain-containing protein [Gongronella butleri]